VFNVSHLQNYFLHNIFLEFCPEHFWSKNKLLFIPIPTIICVHFFKSYNFNTRAGLFNNGFDPDRNDRFGGGARSNPMSDDLTPQSYRQQQDQIMRG